MKIDIDQISFVHYKLREILKWLEEKCWLEQTITSMYRRNDPGVHGAMPLRGVDLRCRYRPIGELLESLINDNWVYDEDRPEIKCCVLHGDGANLHLHVQVHHKTRRKP